MNLSKRDFLQVLGAASVAGMGLGRWAEADHRVYRLGGPEPVSVHDFRVAVRRARSVLRRLGWPTASSSSIGILPR